MKRSCNGAKKEKASPIADDRRRLPRSLSYIDFFAGVGGWTLALQHAVESLKAVVSTADPGSHACVEKVSLHCCAALDHSDLCNDVYRHNHCHGRANKQYRIELLTTKQLNKWKADVWLMSPPCQPHTRQHNNQASDLHDARSASFLHLVRLLIDTDLDPDAIPSIILLENVIGFEQSKSFIKFREALATRNFFLSQQILQPAQVQFPNDRPRFYCVAIRNSHHSQVQLNRQSQVFRHFDCLEDSATVPKIRTCIPELDVHPLSSSSFSPPESSLPTMADFIDTRLTASQIEKLKVPAQVFDRSSAWCFDIVSLKSQRSACFTSGYGRFIKGTGSVLYTTSSINGHSVEEQQQLDFNAASSLSDINDRQYRSDWAKDLHLDQRLRYFSGTEMAGILGFPASFSFPPNVTMKQQWKLMGNSLNVQVASKVIELGLRALNFR
jgi:tRNA (cytosine38-C5)-methyltransferase